MMRSSQNSSASWSGNGDFVPDDFSTLSQVPIDGYQSERDEQGHDEDDLTSSSMISDRHVPLEQVPGSLMDDGSANARADGKALSIAK
eukprot:CAMPEP_0197441160 /NCGR_PEP_ID=MMETSP1175-20131217/7497_1 /TAXON_ID=1003142 /ORGANISM="Triceratium dubium, Strain CCMP147" /LENGTH=87 /DNA_ID=CAMNT_0042971399 /DNA_START=59 /DNA_END=323 /DNA_ORIENTATION=-